MSFFKTSFVVSTFAACSDYIRHGDLVHVRSTSWPPSSVPWLPLLSKVVSTPPASPQGHCFFPESLACEEGWSPVKVSLQERGKNQRASEGNAGNLLQLLLILFPACVGLMCGRRAVHRRIKVLAQSSFLWESQLQDDLKQQQNLPDRPTQTVASYRFTCSDWLCAILIKKNPLYKK